MIPFIVLFPILLLIGAVGIVIGRRADIQRDISNLLDDCIDANGREIYWQTTSTIDVQTNKFIEPYEW